MRLQLLCEWTRQKPTLSERRRGAGPFKERNHASWTPQAIVPKDGIGAISLSNEVISLSQLGAKDFIVRDDQNFAIDQSQTASFAEEDEIEIDAVAATGLINAYQSHVDSQAMQVGLDVPLLELGLFTRPTSFLEFDSLFISNLASNDQMAFEFHRKVFAPSSSTQKSPYPLTVLMEFALGNRTALHFLLAVSHHEIALNYTTHVEPPVQSVNHFRLGSRALISTLSDNVSYHHVETLLSFLYLYHFWLRKRVWYPQKLLELSNTVLAYIVHHGLDSKCEDEVLMSMLQNEFSQFWNLNLVPRILIYLVDRDGFAAFSGWTGALATYALRNEALWFRIMLVSRSVLPAASDIHATVQDIYLKLIFIHHEINLYSQISMVDVDWRLRLEAKLLRISEVCLICK